MKISIARRLRRVAALFSSLTGTTGADGLVRVRRDKTNWALDLSEGIDLSIFLFGGFERSAHIAYKRLLRPGMVVIDIGANVGSHTLPLAACVDSTGRVIAIEPTTTAFQKLQANVTLNPELAGRITTIQAMISAADDLPAPKEIYASWPVDGRRSASTELHPRHGGALLSTEGAQAISLDSLVAAVSIDRIDLIKLDVDGHEMDVLQGGRRVLTEMRPRIVMELAPYTWIERGIGANAPIDLLRSLGYHFTDLSGRRFSPDGRDVPEIAPGRSINIIAEVS